MARNNIKKFEKLDDIGSHIEQLWFSYNQIDKLGGLEQCLKLKVLFLSNNKIENFDELEKLVCNHNLNSNLT